MMKNPEEMSPEELAAELGDSLPVAQKAPEDMSPEELEAELMADKNKPIPPMGAFDTIAGSVINTITGNHAPQLTSAVRNLSFSSPEYVEDRDQYIKQMNNSSSTLKGVGTVAGIGATMMAPIAKLPSAIQKAGPLVKYGAEAVKNFLIAEGMTGLQNPGDIEGEVSGLQSDKRLEAMKDPTNLMINAGVAGLGTAIKVGADKMQAAKGKIAYKALEPSTKGDKLNYSINPADDIDEDRAKKIGQFVYNSEMLKGRPTITEIAARAKNKVKDLGNSIGKKFSEFDEKLAYGSKAGNFKPFNFEELSLHLNKRYEGKAELAEEVAEEVKKIVGDRIIFKDGALKFSDLQKIRQNIQKNVNYDVLHTSNAQMTKTKMYNDAANFFNGYMDNIIDSNKQIFGKQAASEIGVLNSQYKLASDAFKIAANAARDADNSSTAKNFIQNMFNPAGIITGTGAGLYSKNPLIGLGVGALVNTSAAAKNYLVPRANSIHANVANSPKLPKIGENSTIFMKAAQSGMMTPPLLPPDPIMLDKQIKNDPNLKQSEKAKLRNENRKENR